MQYSQEHLKTMVYAEFGGQTECIMGNWKIENCNFLSLACVSSETHNLQRFFRYIWDTKGGHCARRSLRGPWKPGLRIVA